MPDSPLLPSRARAAAPLRIRRLRPVLALAVAVLACGPASAPAYPPAPPFTISGTVRDAYGWPISDESEATILVQSADGIVGIGLVRQLPDPGRNFTLAVPLDHATSATAPYRPDVGEAGAAYQILVRMGGRTYPVFATGSIESAPIAPGGNLVLDLTIGEDSDGDLIPDDWEFWQLDVLGLGPGDPGYGLDFFGDGDVDGDGLSDLDEYVAGTFAFLFADAFNFRLVAVDAAGWVSLEAFQVAGKTYRIEVSPDRRTWQPATVFLDGDRTDGFDAWLADRDGTRPIEVFRGDRPAPGRAFFRIQVR